MISIEDFKNLTLPAELHPLMELKSGLVLISGLANSGKETMSHLLTRELYREVKKSYDYKLSILMHSHHQEHIQEGEKDMKSFLYYPNKYITAEECEDPQVLYNGFPMGMGRFGADLIVDRDIRTSKEAMKRCEYSMYTSIYSTIESESIQEAIEKYIDLVIQYDEHPQFKKDFTEWANKTLRAVIHMKRDETTGLPVVGEVKIF